MRRLLAICLLAFPLGAAAGVPEVPPGATDTTGTVVAETIFKGTIGSMTNYAPLSDVELTLTPFEGGEATTIKTDSTGKFYLAAVQGGVYKVRFEREGYEPGTYQSLYIQPGTTKSFGFLMFEE